MRLSVILILVSVALMCCNNPKRVISTNINNDIIFKTQLITIEEGVPYFKCNDFNPLVPEPRINNIDSLYPKLFLLSKEPFTNWHDSTVIDTIYKFTYRKNVIAFYKAADKNLLAQFDVTDNRFIIAGNIRIGISKEDFKKKFCITSLDSDSVDVGDQEKYIVTRFYFLNNSLIRIRTEKYLD